MIDDTAIDEFVKQFEITKLSVSYTDYTDYSPSTSTYTLELSEGQLAGIIASIQNYQNEQKLRAQFPALQHAYEQYAIILNLVK